MVKIGQEVPEFTMSAYHNDEIIDIKLSDYKGKWVVLLFYPADFTFVCPTELEDAAAIYDKFQALGAEIISVSTDTPFVHKAWHDHSEAIGKVAYYTSKFAQENNKKLVIAGKRETSHQNFLEKQFYKKYMVCDFEIQLNNGWKSYELSSKSLLTSPVGSAPIG